MKKSLLILAFLLSSSLIASDYDFEFTPVAGMNIPEGNLHLDNYATYGAELQYNGFDFPIKPELSFLTAVADYEKNLPGYQDTADTSVNRIALNGVYEFGKMGSVIPLVKAGIGYENMDDPYDENTNSVFLDAGAGLKIPFSDAVALKLEALYMMKENDSRNDNNLAILAGLNFAFGEKAQKAAPVAPKPEPVPAAIIAAPVAAATAVAAAPIDGDDDNDGIKNSVDECPNSPAGAVVNHVGCPVIINLHVKFPFDSAVVDASAGHDIDNFAKFLTTYANYNANIVGHTDSSGPAIYNQGLSERRANAVKEILIEKGIPEDRIISSGKGETAPVASNDTKEGRTENRRIDAELVKQ